MAIRLIALFGVLAVTRVVWGADHRSGYYQPDLGEGLSPEQAVAACADRPVAAVAMSAGSGRWRDYACVDDAASARWAADACASQHITGGAIVDGKLVKCEDVSELSSNRPVAPCGAPKVEAFVSSHFSEPIGLWVEVLVDPTYQFGIVLGKLQWRGYVVLGEACEAAKFDLGCRP